MGVGSALFHCVATVYGTDNSIAGYEILKSIADLAERCLSFVVANVTAVAAPLVIKDRGQNVKHAHSSENSHNSRCCCSCRCCCCTYYAQTLAMPHCGKILMLSPTADLWPRLSARTSAT